MKKGLIITIISILGILSCKFSQNMKRPEIDGFRDFKWGMSKQEVKRLNNSTIIDELDSSIMYQEKLDEDNVIVVFMFTPKGALFATTLVFDIDSENTDIYYKKFREKYLLLIRKYGDATEYHDDDLKTDGLHAVWKFAKTTIMIKFNLVQPYNKYALGIIYVNEPFVKHFLNDDRLKKY